MKGNLKSKLKNKLKKRELSKLKRSYDLLGDIAVIEVPRALRKKERIIANTLLKSHKSIKVVAKKGVHKGVFRLQKIRILAGEKRKETVHKENKVLLKLNVEKVYFSPRLSTERKRIADQIRMNESVLVMFSGCAPYPLVISKNSKAKKIYGVELNPIAHKYGLENVKLNKVTNVELLKGDVRKVVPKLNKKFDRIIMPLPKGAASFLDLALKAVKKKGTIHFYDFLEEKDIPKKAVNKVKEACKKAKKRCKIKRVVKCGQLAPRAYRLCIDFVVE